MTELLFTFIIWLSLFIILKFNSSQKVWIVILLGIIIGLGTLLRANAFLLLIICSIIILRYYKIKRIKLNVYLILGFMVIVLPWALRNYTHFNSLVLSSTNGGFNFLMGNHKMSTGNVNFNFDYNINNPNEVEESDKAYARAINDLNENPIRIFSLIPMKLFWSYWRGDHAVTWALKQTQNHIPALIKSFVFFSTNLYFYTIIGLSLFRFYLLFNLKNMNFVLFFIFLMFYFNILMISVFLGTERYSYTVFVIHLFLSIKLLSQYIHKDIYFCEK